MTPDSSRSAYVLGSDEAEVARLDALRAALDWAPRLH
jgi:hypothetical protein